MLGLCWLSFNHTSPYTSLNLFCKGLRTCNLLCLRWICQSVPYQSLTPTSSPSPRTWHSHLQTSPLADRAFNPQLQTRNISRLDETVTLGLNGHKVYENEGLDCGQESSDTPPSTRKFGVVSNSSTEAPLSNREHFSIASEESLTSSRWWCTSSRKKTDTIIEVWRRLRC